jgi:hypothetical protein
MRPEEPRTFTFDRLFDEKATQSQVFDYVRPLVDAAVDGYNSTLFTYGFTFISLCSYGGSCYIDALLQTNGLWKDLHHVRHRVRLLLSPLINS